MKSFFTTNHVHLKIYGLQNLPATSQDIPRSNEENLAQMSGSPRLLEHTSRQRRSSGDKKLVFPGRVLPSWVLPLLAKPREKSLDWFPLTCKWHGCVTCFVTWLMEKTREKKERDQCLCWHVSRSTLFTLQHAPICRRMFVQEGIPLVGQQMFWFPAF